jgi:hypothetical protein
MFEIELLEEAYKMSEKYITGVVDKIVTFDYSAFLNSAIISGFMFYGKIMTFMTNTYNILYNHFELVRHIDYFIQYSGKYLHSLCFLYSIEPYRLSWYSNCWIEKTSIDQFIFHEKIADSENNGNYCLIDIANENWPHDPIFIGKMMSSINDEPKYYCRLIDGRSTEPDNVDISLFPAIRSFTSFLSITYKHPEMKTAVDLSIHNGWFMEGNEILSPSFIYRELYHQSKSFVFDKRYTLEIIDENINIIEIGYYEFIQIKNDSYEIVNTQKSSVNIDVISLLNQEDEEYDSEFEHEIQETIYGNVSYLSSDSGSKDTLSHNNDHMSE